MTYTIAQFLAAAEAAEVSMIDAQHICDTLVKMNKHPEIGTFRKMKVNLDFEKGEILKVIRVDNTDENMTYKCANKHNCSLWIPNNTHEPTTETF